MKRPSGSRRVRKSCPLTAPKPSAKNAVDSRVAKVGLPSSRTCVGINVRRAWRTIARGAAKPWEPSGTAVCETSVAYLRKQSKLALFFDRRQKFCGQTAPVLGSRNGPQNRGQVVRTQANQIEIEGAASILGSVSGVPKRGPFCRQNFSHRAKNSKSFDCFCAYATEVFHAAAFPWFRSAAGACSPHPANIYGHTCS